MNLFGLPHNIVALGKQLAHSNYKELTRKEKLLRELVAIEEKEQQEIADKLREAANEEILKLVDGKKHFFKYSPPMFSSTSMANVIYHGELLLQHDGIIIDGYGITILFNGNLQSINKLDTRRFEAQYISEIRITDELRVKLKALSICIEAMIYP